MTQPSNAESALLPAPAPGLEPGEAMRLRGLEVAEDLVGTCRGLSEFATHAEACNDVFNAALDAEVFECAVCGWWCRFGDEEAVSAGDGFACDDCNDEEDDDETDDC